MSKGEIPRVSVVISRCRREKGSYGMRFEQRGGGSWTGTWSFPIRESSAKREGYDRTELKGSFSFDESSYPGCPYCGSYGIFKCAKCGKISCWDGETSSVTCAWCGRTGTIKGIIENMKAASDG